VARGEPIVIEQIIASIISQLPASTGPNLDGFCFDSGHYYELS
jgi:hypothetical protein